MPSAPMGGVARRGRGTATPMRCGRSSVGSLNSSGRTRSSRPVPRFSPRRSSTADSSDRGKVRDGALARPHPRPGQLGRVGADRVAVLQASRGLHPPCLPVLPDKHSLRTFGKRPMGKILPTEIERWVTTATTGGATAKGFSAASVRKYRTMLRSVFERAVATGSSPSTPCPYTELPEVVTNEARSLTPDHAPAAMADRAHGHRERAGREALGCRRRGMVTNCDDGQLPVVFPGVERCEGWRPNSRGDDVRRGAQAECESGGGALRARETVPW